MRSLPLVRVMHPGSGEESANLSVTPLLSRRSNGFGSCHLPNLFQLSTEIGEQERDQHVKKC